MMISNDSVIIRDDDNIALDNLYPALLQCFVIITCGYIAGRQNLISNTEAKGLSTFVGTFSLPALIFMSLAEVDLYSVNWMFLLSVFIAKTIIFVTVIVITLLISRPVHPGRAGLFAIFCTQSNDFAIGCPIVEALYGKVHPEYITYLYLMAPISLVILNPLAFVLMEIGKQREIASAMLEDPNVRPKLRMIITVIKNVILNPVVLMTLLGIVGNLVFSHHVPAVLKGLLKVLGSAFSATALFLLGQHMVGKVHILQGKALVVPGILILVKLLALPIVTREVISLLHPGNTSKTVDLSTYGFLYGTFPAAPGVFVFATLYSLDVDLIAVAMVACTFISAPFIFVSAKMITVTNMKPSDFLVELDYFAFDISVIGILASIWMLFTFVCNKKYRRFPQKVTCCLIISQLIGCIGILLWSKLDLTRKWICYLQFAVFTIGVYSSRLWTALLAVVLLFLQCRSLCFVLKMQPYLVMVGWGLPVIAATTMICLQKERIEKQTVNTSFQFSETDTAISLFLLIFCFVVTVGCLILHQRYHLRYAPYSLLLDNTVADDNGDAESDTATGTAQNINTSSNDRCTTGCGRGRVPDIEELGEEDRSHLCPEQFSCSTNVREACYGRVGRYHEETEETEEEEENQQLLQHQILLLLLASSMFVGIAFSIWTLIMEEMSGIYIELAFLDTSLNFGQSIIILAVFGLDTKAVLIPVVKRWRTFWYKTPTVQLPDWNDLSFETRHVCDQFVLHHLDNCQSEIARDKRWRFRTYKKVFTGSALIDWLILTGLARDRTEASQYATFLINGRVLRHVERLHHFHDRYLLYTFEP